MPFIDNIIMLPSHLSSAFAFVDDLQSVRPASRVLYTLMDHCKVPISDHSTHFVPI